MEKAVKQQSNASKWLLVIIGIVNILASIFCFMNPLATDAIIPIAIGIAFLVNGAITCYDYFFTRDKASRSVWMLVLAIALIIGGILMITRDLLGLFTITYFVAYLTAIMLVVVGVVRSIDSFSLNSDGFKSWWLILVLGVLDVIVGIMLFMNPLYLAYYAGAGLLVDGINELVLAFAL